MSKNKKDNKKQDVKIVVVKEKEKEIEKKKKEEIKIEMKKVEKKTAEIKKENKKKEKEIKKNGYEDKKLGTEKILSVRDKKLNSRNYKEIKTYSGLTFLLSKEDLDKQVIVK